MGRGRGINTVAALCSAILAIAFTPSPAKADASSVSHVVASGWMATDFHDQTNPGCSIGSDASAPGGRLMMGANRRRPDPMNLLIRKTGWLIPAGTQVQVKASFPDGSIIGFNGRGNGQTIEIDIATDQLRGWLHELTTSATMQIVFGGNEPPWTFDLSGSTTVVNAMGDCFRDHRISGVAPPFDTTTVAGGQVAQPFSPAQSTQPFGTGQQNSGENSGPSQQTVPTSRMPVPATQSPYAQPAKQSPIPGQSEGVYLDGQSKPPIGDGYWYICDMSQVCLGNDIGSQALRRSSNGTFYSCNTEQIFYPYQQSCFGRWKQTPASGVLPPKPQQAPAWIIMRGPQQQKMLWDDRLNEIATEYLSEIENQKKNAQIQIAQREAEAKENQRRQEDEQNGYKYLSIQDFILDKDELTSDQKLIIRAFLHPEGDANLLVQYPGVENRLSIGVIDEYAPRDVRKAILNCRQFGGCMMTFIGHVVGCEETMFGKPYKSDRCLSVESIR